MNEKGSLSCRQLPLSRASYLRIDDCSSPSLQSCRATIGIFNLLSTSFKSSKLLCETFIFNCIIFLASIFTSLFWVARKHPALCSPHNYFGSISGWVGGWACGIWTENRIRVGKGEGNAPRDGCWWIGTFFSQSLFIKEIWDDFRVHVWSRAKDFYPRGLFFQKFTSPWLFTWTTWHCSVGTPLGVLTLWNGRRLDFATGLGLHCWCKLTAGLEGLCEGAGGHWSRCLYDHPSMSLLKQSSMLSLVP